MAKPVTTWYDRLEKRDIYAAHKLSYLWFTDPGEPAPLKPLNCKAKTGFLPKTYGHDVMVDAKPFDAVPFELAALWFDEQRVLRR